MKILSLIIAALVGAGIAIGITLGVSSGSKSEPANQNLTNQLTVVQTDLRDVKTTVEGTKAQTADTNTRVKDIQQRLERCPCGKPAKPARKKIAARKLTARKQVAREAAKQTAKPAEAETTARPPVIIRNLNVNSNTGLPLASPPPEPKNVPPGAIIIDNTNINNNPTHISPEIPAVPPATAPNAALQPQTRSKPKKESHWYRLWDKKGWCDCGTEFSPRWNSHQYHQG